VLSDGASVYQIKRSEEEMENIKIKETIVRQEKLK